MSDATERNRKLHEAMTEYVQDGELVVGWSAVIEVVGPDGQRHLKHRSGGRGDGSESPEPWTELGYLRAGVTAVEDDLRRHTRRPDQT